MTFVLEPRSPKFSDDKQRSGSADDVIALCQGECFLENLVYRDGLRAPVACADSPDELLWIGCPWMVGLRDKDVVCCRQDGVEYPIDVLAC